METWTIGSSQHRRVHEDRAATVLQHTQLQDIQNMVSAGSIIKNYEMHTKKVASKIGAEFGHIHFHGFEDSLINDKTVECINESLIHIVTNSVVHGYKQENLHLLSDQKVKIDVDMTTRDQKLQITIKDSGCGIDYTKVKEKALSQSPELKDKIESFSPNEILQLIFTPNFSTYDNEDQFAGRGIGMFAVTQAVESLGGSIHVESKWTEGTTFTIEIPQYTAEGANCLSITLEEPENSNFYQQAG